MPSHDLLASAYNVVADYPGGSTALAPLIGKGASTLSHEVDLRYPGAKLGLHDAGKLTAVTGDLRIVQAFCALAGGRFQPLPSTADTVRPAQPLVAVGAMAHEFAQLVSEAGAALADGHVTPNERHRIQREAGELLAALNHLLALCDAAVPGQGARP
jgi:hypothetical protein